MSIYKPTWLYIKQHNQTGLKYFGKTVRKDPYKYKGSGKYWKSHIKSHGNDVSTVWCKLFENEERLIEYALTFSKENDIVRSPLWANLEPENGINGCPPGTVPWNKNKKATTEHIANAANAQRGKKKPKVSEERKAKQRDAMIGRPGRIPTTEEIIQRRHTRKSNDKLLNRNYCGEGNSFFNKRHTEETKNKIRDKNLGKKLSPESIVKREATKRASRIKNASTSL